jgi:EpsI family protein
MSMSGSHGKALIAILILIAFGGFGAYVRSHQAEIERPADYIQIPLETDKYLGLETRFPEYTYDILKADTTTLRMYTDRITGDVYWLFVAYFSSQKYGSQIHSPIHCVPGGGYRIHTIKPHLIRLEDGRDLAVRRLLVESKRRREVMFYWFETRGGVIASEYGLKFDLMKNSVLLMPTDAAICRVNVPLPVTADFDEAAARAEQFIRDIYPSLENALPFD